MESNDITGKSLKMILSRMESSKDIFQKVVEVNENNCSHDCTNCKYHTRKEGYDQEWGMFKFMFFYCDKGNNVMFHVKSDCSDFKYGENKFIYMTEPEKKKIDNSYYKPRKNLIDDYAYRKITVEDVTRDFCIDIKDKDGNYRPLYNVLKDIHNKWITSEES